MAALGWVGSEMQRAAERTCRATWRIYRFQSYIQWLKKANATNASERRWRLASSLTFFFLPSYSGLECFMFDDESEE